MTLWTPQRLALILIVSLSVNLFVGGMLFSRWLWPPAMEERSVAGVTSTGETQTPREKTEAREKPSQRARDSKEGKGGGPMKRWMRRAPDAESRMALGLAWKARGEAVRTAFSEMHRARAETIHLLEAERLDVEALDAAFTTLREKKSAGLAAIHGMILETAQGLTQEQRKAMYGKKRRKKHRDHHTHHPMSHHGETEGVTSVVK
ncbi:MAG: periplasmic heavy metal sensor [Magnetococcales bacterium]|nr:periplasmic heavy metal sensor [Magnetococcales bacterium]